MQKKKNLIKNLIGANFREGLKLSGREHVAQVESSSIQFPVPPVEGFQVECDVKERLLPDEIQ